MMNVNQLVVINSMILVLLSYYFYYIAVKRDENRTRKLQWARAGMLFIVILALMSRVFLYQGVRGGIQYLILSLVDVLVFISIFYFVLLMLLSVFRRYFTGHFCSFLWIIPMILILRFPISLLAYRNHIPIYLYLPFSEKLLNVIVGIWITGGMVVMGYQLWQHYMICNKLQMCSTDVSDPVLQIAKEICEQMEIQDTIEIFENHLIRSPLSIKRKRGKVTIYLPAVSYSKDELRMIFRHELCHIRRDDIGVKFFLSICRAICWFHPFVWVAIRKASEDMELSCDEVVIHMSQNSRKEYARLLLHSAGEERGYTTCLSGKAKSLQYRMHRILNGTGKAYSGWMMIGMIVLMCSLAYGSIQVTYGRGTISSEIATAQEMQDLGSQIFYDDAWSAHSISEVLVSREGELEGQSKITASKYIEQIRIERIATGMQYDFAEDRKAFLAIDNKLFVTISDHILMIQEIGKSTEYYHITSEVHWDQIM